MEQARANLDAGYVLDYIQNNVTVPAELQGDEYDKGLVTAISAFFAGMKCALENIDMGDE